MSKTRIWHTNRCIYIHTDADDRVDYAHGVLRIGSVLVTHGKSNGTITRHDLADDSITCIVCCWPSRAYYYDDRVVGRRWAEPVIVQDIEMEQGHVLVVLPESIDKMYIPDDYTNGSIIALAKQWLRDARAIGQLSYEER